MEDKKIELEEIEIDDSYEMDMDDEEDYEDDYDEDDYDADIDDESGNFEEVVVEENKIIRELKDVFDRVQKDASLSQIVELIRKFQDYVDVDNKKLKHILVDVIIGDRLGIKDMDILFGHKDSDVEYKELLKAMVPELQRINIIYDHNRDMLFDKLSKATLIMFWLEIEKRANNLDYQNFVNNIRYFSFYCKNDDLKMSDFVAGATRDFEEVGITKAILGAYIILSKLSVFGEKVKEISNEGVEYNPKVDSMEVRAIVNDIMNIYDMLYGPCFVNRPYGILTANGILTLKKDGSGFELMSEGINYATRLYKGFMFLTDTYLPLFVPNKDIDSSYISNSGELLVSYSPYYHVRNIFGITKDNKKINTWGEFRDILYNDVFEKVTSTLEKVDHDTINIQNTVKDLFTNCIIIDELDRVRILRMRAKIANLRDGVGGFIESNAKKLFASDTGKLVNELVDRVGIHNILYIFDEKAYNAEILFAYKAYEKLIFSGLRPSANNVILGRDLKGDDVIENLNDAGNVVIGVIAGSRSGKGVLTLNILASLYADNCPVMYLDYKPDMAATLWDLERDLKGQGVDCNIFSIDAMADRRNDGVVPVRSFSYGMNAPGYADLSREDFSLIPYLKSMQFACILAQLRSSGELDSKKKIFFVLDEAQKVNSRFGIFLEKVSRGVKVNTPKKGEEETDVYKYYFNLKEIFNSDLKDGIKNVINTVGGMGRVSLIVLGQKADPDEWKLQGEGSWRSGLFGNLIGSCNIKLIGRDSGNSPSYGIPNLKKSLQGGEFLDERGYFVKYRGAKTPEKGVGCELLKSYLVLNKNDFDLEAYKNNALDPSTFTGALITNISDSVIRASVIRDDFINIDGSIRESVGFGGLMKLIMGGKDNHELGRKLSTGYACMHQLFVMLGFNKRYSCVEEYLYDCAPDSLFSISDLNEIIRTGGISGSVEDVNWFNTTSKREDSRNSNMREEINNGVDERHIWGKREDSRNSNMREEINNGVDEKPIWDKRVAGDEEDDYPDISYGDVREGSKDDNSYFDTDVKKRGIGEDVVHDKYAEPNKDSAFSGEYVRPITVDHNPFKMYGVNNNPIMSLSALKMTSGILLDEIRRAFLDFNRIEHIALSNNGLLVINNIKFKPKFSESVIESMPFDIKDQILKGHVVELFNFKDLYRFKNLMHLEVDALRLAEGRMRREMCIHPKASWNILFKKFPYLKSLIIAGNVITDEKTARDYDIGAKSGYSLTEKLADKFKIGTGFLSSSRMDKVWDSSTFKVFRGALGFTLGVKGLLLASSLFGPWGMLFGAFSLVGTAREMKKRKFF